MLRLALGLALIHFLSEGSALKICAFNVQSFGDSKMRNPVVVPVLLKMLPRYDIILVQEVRDTDRSAVVKLMDELNGLGSGDEFSYVISDPLGRESYTEQYLFIYRNKKVSVQDSYHFHDHNMYTGQDTFSREPFVVMFNAPETVIGSFVLVPLHAAPKDAVSEIDGLYDVYEDVWNKWETDNIMFLGDFNAACSYVSSSDWQHIRLRDDGVFSWLIEDDVDTTVGATFCAYDRIVVSGSDLKEAIVPGSAKVFNFQQEYKLSTEDALSVSDHYPVEVELMRA